MASRDTQRRIVVGRYGDSEHIIKRFGEIILSESVENVMFWRKETDPQFDRLF